MFSVHYIFCKNTHKIPKTYEINIIMMEDEKPVVVGLDIGSTKICAIAGSLDEKSNKIDIHAVIEKKIEGGVNNGTIVNIDNTRLAIDSVLKQLADKININIEGVHVNISGSHINGQMHHSTITRKEGGNIVMTEDLYELTQDIRRTFQLTPGKTILHALPQEFIVNNMRVTENPAGRVGVRLGGDFYVITSGHHEHSVLRQTLEKVKANTNGEQTYVEVDNILFSPLADTLAVLSDTDKKAGVAVVNIGGETTEVAIFHEKGLRHVAVIPYAGNSIRNDLMEGCRILLEQAETLKLVCGTMPVEAIGLNEIVGIEGIDGIPQREVSMKNAIAIIEERLKEIASIVKAEIVRSGYDNRLISGIVLTGGSANIKDIVKIFERVTDMNVRIGKLRNIGHSSFEQLDNPKYTTAIGLIWSEFRKLDDRIPDSKPKELVENRTKIHEKPKAKSALENFMAKIMKNNAVKGDEY